MSKVTAAAKQGSRDEVRDLKAQHRVEVAELKSELLAAQAVVADREKQLLVAQNDIAQLHAEKKIADQVEQLQEMTEMKNSLSAEKVKLLEERIQHLSNASATYQEQVVIYKDQIEALKAQNVTTPRSSFSDNSQRTDYTD